MKINKYTIEVISYWLTLSLGQKKKKLVNSSHDVALLGPFRFKEIAFDLMSLLGFCSQLIIWFGNELYNHSDAGNAAKLLVEYCFQQNNLAH